MSVLHNRVSQKELKQRLLQEAERRTTLSFYRYIAIGDPRSFRDDLYKVLSELAVFGRVYVAAEGINAQISVPESRFGALKDRLDSISGLGGLRLNIAVDNDGKSFWVLKIKVREKIVADGIDDPGFDMSRKGRYVDAEMFNRLTADPATIVVDMRNHYEYEVGHFENAIEVPSDTFREQLPMTAELLKDKKDSPIIMYCTGGIRCEKASAWLLHKGFSNVFHLEGGIIHYANTVKDKGWKINSGVRILFLMIVLGNVSAAKLSPVVINAAVRPIRTTIAEMRVVIFFSSSARSAPSGMRVVVVLNASRLFICPKRNSFCCGKGP